MDIEEQINPIDRYIPVIAEAVDAWKAKNTPEVIRERIFALLDKHSEEITLKLLGFDKDSWGRKEWKLDHCNGRSGNSAAGDYLMSTQSTVIKEWLSKVQLPKLTPKLKAQLEKDLQSNYEHRAKTDVYSVAARRAEQDMTALVAQVVCSNKADNYVKAMALINAEETA